MRREHNAEWTAVGTTGIAVREHGRTVEVRSNLHGSGGDAEGETLFDAAVDGIEALVLALVSAGFDPAEPRFADAVQNALDAVANQLGDR